jgi:exonuclease SbcD
LLALRETGAHVVVVGGNHDQQSQLEAVAPVFARLGITVLGLPTGPDRAVVDVAGARIALMPWMSQRWAIKTEQLMGAPASQTVQYYAARVSRLLGWLCEGFAADTVNIVAAHCMVRGGARAAASATPR